MIRFPRWSSLLLVTLAVQAAGCISYPFRGEVVIDQTLPADGLKKLVVDNRNGPIEVRCDQDRGDIHVHAVKFARGLTLDDAQDHAGQIEVEMERDPADQGVLRLVSRVPYVDWNRGPGTSFRIHMPPGAELHLETSNGRVDATGCAGQVVARSSNGTITIEKVQGTVDASTSNGRIVARDVDGNIRVRTSNGGIELERVGKESIEAVTSNGRIRIADARGEAALRTSNGSIEMRLTSVPSNPRIRAVTSNGHVDVELPGDVSARLDMHTSNGRVTANLQGLRVGEIESSRSRLSATLNEGGGLVEIRSSNGSISLRTVGIGKDAAGTTEKKS